MLLLVNLSVIQSVHLCPCGLGCGVRPRSHREPPSAGPYRRTCADPHRRLSGPPFALRTCSPSPNSSFGPSAPSPGPFRPCAPASSCIEKRRLPDRSFFNIFISWPPHVPSAASNLGAVAALFGFWNAFSSGFKALTAFSSPLGSSSLAGMLSSLHLQCSPWLTSATLPVTERKDTVIVLKLLTAQGARQKLNSCSSAWWQGQGAAPSTSTNMGRAPRLGGKGVGQGRPPQGDVALT